MNDISIKLLRLRSEVKRLLLSSWKRSLIGASEGPVTILSPTREVPIMSVSLPEKQTSTLSGGEMDLTNLSGGEMDPTNLSGGEMDLPNHYLPRHALTICEIVELTKDVSCCRIPYVSDCSDATVLTKVAQHAFRLGELLPSVKKHGMMTSDFRFEPTRILTPSNQGGDKLDLQWVLVGGRRIALLAGLPLISSTVLSANSR